MSHYLFEPLLYHVYKPLFLFLTLLFFCPHPELFKDAGYANVRYTAITHVCLSISKMQLLCSFNAGLNKSYV